MSGTRAQRSKTRREIEEQLMAELEQARERMQSAPEEEKTAARERFSAVLRKFNAFILNGVPPDRET